MFGNSAPSFGATSTFGGGGTSPFGSSSTSLFGGSQTGAFGASGSGFGGFAQSSAPGFGQAAASGFGFGQSSTPAFGAFGQASGSTFGAFGQSSTPAFGSGFGQATGSTFGFGQASGGAFGSSFQSKPFGASSGASLFGGTTGTGLFGGSQPAFGQQQQQQQQQQWQSNVTSPEQQEFQNLLVRKDGRPLTTHTTFRDLQDGGQNVLHKIEQEVIACQRFSEELKEHDRLEDEGERQKEFDKKVAGLRQMITLLRSSVKSDREALEALTPVDEWLHSATLTAGGMSQRGQVWKKAKQELLVRNSLTHADRDLSSLSELPNRHLGEAVQELQDRAEMLSGWALDVENSLNTSQRKGVGSASATVEDLEEMLTNMNAFFMSVGSDIEKLQSEVNRAKEVYLRGLEQRGIARNPFEEADREEARKESIHKKPTPSQLRSQQMSPLLPSPMQQNIQQAVAPAPQPGLFGGITAASTGGLFGGQTTGAFGGGGLFGAQSSGPSTSLFGQSSPAAGAFGATGSLFGPSSGAGGFGAASSGTSLFGGASSTAAGFGTTTPVRKQSRTSLNNRRPCQT